MIPQKKGIAYYYRYHYYLLKRVYTNDFKKPESTVYGNVFYIEHTLAIFSLLCFFSPLTSDSILNSKLFPIAVVVYIVLCLFLIKRYEQKNEVHILREFKHLNKSKLTGIKFLNVCISICIILISFLIAAVAYYEKK